MGTDLTIARDHFLALNESSPQVRALRANTRFSPVKVRDLIQVKNPSGGATAWELETAAGTKYEKELTGVILHVSGRRVLWASRNVGSGEMPLCSSVDLYHGKIRRKDKDDPASPVDIPDHILQIGVPGGDDGTCPNCAFNQWGTGVDGSGHRTRGKRCGEQRVLYFLRENDILPLRIRVPAGSIGGFDTWMKQISNEGVCFNECLVKMRLEKKQSTAGADYAALTPEFKGPLSPEAVEGLAEYCAVLKSVFESDDIVDAPESDAPAAKNPYKF